MVNKIKKVSRLAVQALDMLGSAVVALFYRNDERYKGLWLISERGTDAKDNGFVFFEYLREKHPEINARFVYSLELRGTIDFKKLEKYEDRLIDYKSLEHKVAFLLCEKAISSHTGFLCPWAYKLYKLILDRGDKKPFIYLQHGVILHDLSYYLSKKKIRADRFITTTKREHESICAPAYGYSEGEVVQTGIARYDRLGSFELKNQILIMPTWRQNLVHETVQNGQVVKPEVFYKSEYYRRFNSVINNKRLEKALKEKNLELIFYPHHEIQPLRKFFDTKSSVLKVADKDHYDVQTLLKESKLLVTDFSSIAFDFAYMRKPLCYYQFDSIDDHYSMGYFSYEKDGFGPVFNDENECVDFIIRTIEKDFALEDCYSKRIEDSFMYRDSSCCDRIFEVVKSTIK